MFAIGEFISAWWPWMLGVVLLVFGVVSNPAGAARPDRALAELQRNCSKPRLVRGFLFGAPVIAFLGAIVVSFSVGLGLGVGGTFYLLWKRGVFSFDVNDIKVGGTSND